MLVKFISANPTEPVTVPQLSEVTRPRTLRLLPPADRHLVRRFSYGITAELAQDVREAGGGAAWFEDQLHPSRIPDVEARSLDQWWPELAMGAQTLWDRQEAGVQAGWQVMESYQRRALQRRVRTDRPVLELMADFWENHLNVPANGDAQFTYRADYGAVIRAGALGRFSDLLTAAVTHPAMLIYLDQASSTAEHPIENLGREVLELHTLGTGNYTEKDVKNSSRILTGWRVDLYDTWKATYERGDHWRGKVKVRDFTDRNQAGDGRALTRRYLSYLAHQPETARHLVTKLATRFVRDNPSPALVSRLAKVYLKHGTSIAAVLRALVASPEFARSADLKLRDPGEDVVATYRALGIRMGPPVTDGSAVNAVLWQAANLGATPFSWPRPDGQPWDNDSWASTSRLMASMQVHYGLSGGWWPNEDVTYREPADWLPAERVRFRDLVDHVSRRLDHRPASDTLLKACCQATDRRPGELITPDHDLVKWSMPRLLTTVLDAPGFFAR